MHDAAIQQGSSPGEVWSIPPDGVVELVQVDIDRGLSNQEVARRRATFGPNLLHRTKRRSDWAILWDQLRSVITLLLVFGAGLSFAFGEIIDCAAITAVIVLNTAIGFFTEARAIRSMESLRRLGSVTTRVRRDGRTREIPAEELVPGDVVVIEGGDVITADLRLVEASRLQANEAALTGESMPVSKSVAAVAAEASLSERRSMVFKGTEVTRGAGTGVVVATGMDTELGTITALVAEAQAEPSPLQQRLDRFGRRLAVASVGFAALVGIAGFLSGKELFLVVQTAIALAVATVPEGLPIVATLALARGMWRMARRNALIEQLAAVETLGSVTVILTDKTGTLTKNRMTLVRLCLPDLVVDITGTGMDEEGEFLCGGAPVRAAGEREALERALTIGALCNDASVHHTEASGDPMEVALLIAARKAGLTRDDLLAGMPEVREEAFDPEIKMMATVHRVESGFLVAVKGAPEAVLECCRRVAAGDREEELPARARSRWKELGAELAADGLRVLALASKRTDREDDSVYEGLTLVGLAGLMDPARDRVRNALDACRRAGIRVVMVTGDHIATAVTVGRTVGLTVGDDDRAVTADTLLGSDPEHPRVSLRDVATVARTSPEQKLRLIEQLQDSGEVVAMIGDGVNDAPALRRADIGIAMGVRGTQVAREAAAMVLRDDEFATIPDAVEQGRVIFANIRKFVVYLLSCNLSEILIVGSAAAVNAPLPILPLQILFLNLVTDVFPALALGVGERTEATMRRTPRERGEPFLTRRHWQRIVGYSFLITVPVLAAFVLAREWLGLDATRTVTVSFLTLALAQLVHVFNMAERGAPPLRNEVTRNPWVWGALALCAVLLLAAVFSPGLASVLRVESPGLRGWALVAVMGSMPLLCGLLLRSRRQ